MTDDGCAQVQEAGAFDVLVETVGHNMESADIQGAAAELIEKIASDELIQKFCTKLIDFSAKITSGDAQLKILKKFQINLLFLKDD